MVKKVIIQSLEPIVKYKMKLEISRKFGGDGLKIFILIDKLGEIDYEELIKSSKLTNEKVNEIIDFMENLGLVYTEGVIDKVSEEEIEKKEPEIKEGYVYKLVSNDSLLRFKHQKIIFKEYSSQGVKIYDIIRKGETSLNEIKKETKIDETKIVEILEFLKNNEIIVEKESDSIKKAKIEKEERERVSAIEEKIRKEEEEKIEMERKKLEEERVKLHEKIQKEEEERKKLEEKLRKEEEEKEKLRKKLEKERKEEKKEVIEKEIVKKEEEIQKIQEKHAEHKEKEEEFIFKVDDIDEEEFNLFAKDTSEEIKPEKKIEPVQEKVKEEEEEFNFGGEEIPEEEFSFEKEEVDKKPTKKIEPVQEEEEESFELEEESEEEQPEQVQEIENKEEEEEEFSFEEEEKEEIPEEENEIEKVDVHYKAKDIQLSEKYRKQKEIFEKFGPEGMKLYSMFTFETTIENAIQMTKMDEEKARKIIEYLINEDLIETSFNGVESKKRLEKVEDEEEESVDLEEEINEEEIEDENYNFTNIKIYNEEEVEEEEEQEVETKTQVYERKLRDEFGDKGVKIYRLIDGRKNAEQIMKEVGVDEDTIIKVFEFMEKEGMIKLEHPSSSKPSEEEEKENKEQTKKKMEPISDMSTSSTKKIIIDDRIPIDVPIIKKMSLPDKMALEAKLLARFGAKSLRINTKMNDEKDVVGLAIEMAISLDDLDEILYSISNAGGCTFATLSNEDIKRRYGDEAFELYELFGRDGIMLYELIGKMNIMEIIKFTKIEPRKAASIIYKANLLLGIDDIDEETIYKSIKDVK